MTCYSMFFENDLPETIGIIQEIASHFKIDVSDVEIWHEARKSETPPHLGNVYMNILFSRLEKAITERYPKLTTDYIVGGSLGSYFYINQEQLSSLDQFIKLVIS